MRRLAGQLVPIGCALSLVACVAVCVLWMRGLTHYDNVSWTYDRYLPDRSAASNEIDLASDKRLWLKIYWGHVGPPAGNVWGYYIRADQSGGHPRLRYRQGRYDKIQTWPGYDPDRGMTGWGPLRWHLGSRTKARDGDDFHFINIGVSPWVLAMLFLVPPMFWLNRYRKYRRARRLGLCPACGYDLRATPDRCPECGLILPVIPPILGEADSCAAEKNLLPLLKS